MRLALAPALSASQAACSRPPLYDFVAAGIITQRLILPRTLRHSRNGIAVWSSDYIQYS